MKRNAILIILTLAFTLGLIGEFITLPGLNKPAQISIDKYQIYIIDKEKIQFLSTAWKYITTKDKVFISTKKDFMVEIADKTGKILFSISRDYKRIKIDSSFVNNFFAWVKKNRPPHLYERMKRLFEFPDYLPAIFDIIIDKDILYIITYKRKKEKNEVFLYTTTGKFIKPLDIPLYKEHPIDTLPYTIHDGKLFQLIDNAETEEWELCVTPIK
jgi:hypothetical protein